MRLLLVICLSAMVGTPLFAQASCDSLKAELATMLKAQQAVMGSLVGNHNTFAETLEEYADSAGEAPRVASQQMKKSAQAFRVRGAQAQKLQLKLQEASQDLSLRIQKCL